MTKVITYGTFDLLHYGHIRLLERAKALGDYLIVGVTADDFDKTRGKINVQQSLMERVEAVRATGVADEIIIEEYEGQKIDDIKRYDIDIFTVGSDWVGKFDYLNEFCEVIYLERTQGVSSSEIRSERSKIRIAFLGDEIAINKFNKECDYVNGLESVGFINEDEIKKHIADFDAIYVASSPTKHFEQIKYILNNKKHVLCESPIALCIKEKNELHDLANQNHCILMDSIKTAYSTAYSRLLLLIKSGKIGKVVSVDATATSLRDITTMNCENSWNSINAWGPTAMLPVLQVLGTNYSSKKIITHLIDLDKSFDSFTKIDFLYSNAVATVKVGKGVKSEGELVISGTNGYIYVPAPWWKMDYFEVRYENPVDNKRYFYQLDGEGIRYELVAFLKTIESKKYNGYISREVSDSICKIVEDFYARKDVILLK